MRTQLQAVSLRLQTLRSNEQMAQAMKGATRVSHFSNHCSCSELPMTMLIIDSFRSSKLAFVEYIGNVINVQNNEFTSNK